MKVALFGNPNTGKSSIFNSLTGAKQKVGNFPGITIDRYSATFQLAQQTIELIDFPGTYSLYPNSKDEEIVYDVLTNTHHIDYPDLAIITLDASNLERNIFLLTQIDDLKIPYIVALNMMDIAQRKNIKVDVVALANQFSNATFVQCNARIKLGIDRLKNEIAIRLDQINSLENNSTYRPALKDDLKSQKVDNVERSKRINQICVSQIIACVGL